jgi:hypothetical protein
MDDTVKQAEELLAQMPPEQRARMMRDWWEAATREPEPAAPVFTMIPPPQLPWSLRSTAVRYPCMTGCGWAHEEDPGRELPGPLVLPANFTSEDVSAAITAEVEQRRAAADRRIEEALLAHYAQAHPGQEPHRRRLDSRTPEPHG